MKGMKQRMLLSMNYYLDESLAPSCLTTAFQRKTTYYLNVQKMQDTHGYQLCLSKSLNCKLLEAKRVLWGGNITQLTCSHTLLWY